MPNTPGYKAQDVTICWADEIKVVRLYKYAADLKSNPDL